MDLSNSEHLTIARLAALIRRRKLSPLELTRWVLERIDRHQPSLNSYITVTSELALEQARQMEREIGRGLYRGALHGIPVCVKDLIYTSGIRTTAGSHILRRFIPEQDAAVVERLKVSGAVVVGKTNLHEFAYGPTNINPHFGPSRNPWDSKRMTGGSSGGSAAAVSAALALAGLGTDTGGSIRIPAAACGCVGLKASYGRVPLHGVIPLATTLDHVGPLARCVEDAALMYLAIAGPDTRDPSTSGIGPTGPLRGLRSGVRSLKVGIPKRYFFDRLQPDVQDAVQAALRRLEELGAELVELKPAGMRETPDLASLITGAEALAYHERWLGERPQAYGEDVRARLEGSRGISATEYILALKRRALYAARLEAQLESVQILASPTLPVEAPEIGAREVVVRKSKEDTRLALLRLTRPGNLSGLPAISIPCGFTSSGLPVGLQLLGRRFDEASILRAAWAYEQATPWHRMFPPAD